MATMDTVPTTARHELERGFGGTLTGPGDAGYDEARVIYNAMIDKHPALVARCTDAGDVARALRFGRDLGLDIAIRGGGHSGPGFGVVDGGLVIDLSGIRSVQVDPEAAIAEVGGGALLKDLDQATHSFGLATPGGIVSTTGVGGLTLGGGHGYLTRKYGLTSDNLLEAEVVLADGTRIQANESRNADLFWALRGGGGNFGVVTSFKFRLHPVKTVIAGPVLWPIESTAEVMRWYREFLAGAPRDVYAWLGLHTVPPSPLFPPELHLRKVVFAMVCYLGPADQAGKALAPMREFGPPLLYGVQELPYPVLQSLFDELYCPGLQWYWRHDFVRELSDPAIERHVELGRRRPTLHSTMHLYPVDGAVHDLAADETAFRYRDVRWSQVIVGVDPDPARAGELRSFAVDYWEALHPHSAVGSYVNMMMDDEGRDRVRASYGANYQRLAGIKAHYDPENVFHLNQNVDPRTPDASAGPG